MHNLLKTTIKSCDDIPLTYLMFVNVETDDNEEVVNFHLYIPTSYLIPELKVGNDGWVTNPPKRYRIRIDQPRNIPGEKHIHIYKNGEFIAINQSGTKRHGKGERVQIPRRLYDWIKKNLRDFNISNDRFIEFKNMDIPQIKNPIKIDVDDWI